MFSFMYFSNDASYWVPILFVQATILAVSLYGLYLAVKKSTLKTGKLLGFGFLILSAAVFLTAQHVGWFAPEWLGTDLDTFQMSTFLALPIFLIGVVMIAGAAEENGLDGTFLEVGAGLILVHAFFANVFIMQNSW